ncbi:hypothetical protein PT974_01108 [Cladobotryum mycophilum]|uniref:Uncharacterized protein n=1 Tax=Cladobotryum mycophilum TaxID=491253 RepID=A0ABR0T2R4_9HYPO
MSTDSAPGGVPPQGTRLVNNCDLFLCQVHNMAIRAGIWEYVNPNWHLDLDEPLRPEMPLHPELPPIPSSQDPAEHQAHASYCTWLERQYVLEMYSYTCEYQVYQEEMEDYKTKERAIRDLFLFISENTRNIIPLIELWTDHPREQLRILTNMFARVPSAIPFQGYQQRMPTDDELAEEAQRARGDEGQADQ